MEDMVRIASALINGFRSLQSCRRGNAEGQGIFMAASFSTYGEKAWYRLCNFV